MATTEDLGHFINEYVNPELIWNELVGRDAFLQNVKQDTDWVGGDYIVGMVGGSPSSIKFGGLTAANDVSELTDLRGKLTTQPELFGTLLFREKDLRRHTGVDARQAFLTNYIEDVLPTFITGMKTKMSIVLTGGPHFATLTANGTAGGIITVDKPELFDIHQKVILRNSTPTSAVGYVQAINVSTSQVHLQTTMAGGVDLNCAAFTTALSAKCYYDGLVNSGTHAIQNKFTSMRSAFLSAANGGDASYLGLTKATYPVLQAVNSDGSDITATNIVDKIFYKYSTEIGRKAKNKKTGKKPSKLLLSDKNYANVMAVLNDQKGAFSVLPTSSEVKSYQWDTIKIGSNQGVVLELFNVPEIDDDIIPCVDWSTIKLASNGGVQIVKSPDGNKYKWERDTDAGHYYLVDVAFYGDAVYTNLQANGIIAGISY